MTPHFSDKEVSCRCGCGLLPEQSFMDKVEDLRVVWGGPLRVLRGASCAKHNAEVSSTGANGPHVLGHAIDLEIPGDACWVFLHLVFFTKQFTGIGIKQKGQSRAVHLDDLTNAPGQPRPRVWTY